MRRERPHQGAQLRFEDVGGYRLTALATNTRIARLVDLEVRHRLRERCQGIAYGAQNTGLDHFPLQGFTQNRIWCLLMAPVRRPLPTTTTKDPWPVERPDHRETTRGKPSHPHTTIPATTPATTPQTSTQPADEKSRPRRHKSGPTFNKTI